MTIQAGTILGIPSLGEANPFDQQYNHHAVHDVTSAMIFQAGHNSL